MMTVVGVTPKPPNVALFLVETLCIAYLALAIVATMKLLRWGGGDPERRIEVMVAAGAYEVLNPADFGSSRVL